MELPMTPKPMPASAPDLPANHTGKLFGIVYITLTGVIDTIILAASPWSWVGKAASYFLKLARLLLWALPARNPVDLPLKTTVWPPKTGSLTLMPLVAPSTSVMSQLDGDLCNPELLWAFHLGQFSLERLDPYSGVFVVGPSKGFQGRALKSLDYIG
ncbi:hypothetical protein DSO57_1024045 [Entomophthora muscae]|uniref:Uncharacterized protein n=1 Tax=Entomophthora muscae TaxID=34485 RepID=A0ACC2RHA1_9FUNG|nr:hypothetical protein DSO57_1024045 [Entomophthora muscae]